MSTVGLSLDNKSWLARRNGYIGTLSGDEIPAGLDNLYLRTSARKLDDFEFASYATDASLRIQWSVGGGATLPTLSSAANALSGDASLEIVADAATSTIFREWARERFGYAWPGGSTPVLNTTTGIGSFLFGPIRGVRFRATHSGVGAATLFVMLRNVGGTISRRWNVLIDGSGATLHFVDFTSTPDATVGVWDETVVSEFVFGNLTNAITYRFDDIDFLVESDIQDILYEIWRLSGTGGVPSSIQTNRSYPTSIEVTNTGTWSLELFDPAGGISIATADIIAGNYTIDRLRQGAVTNIVASTVASRSAGTIFATYTPPVATWEPGDLIRLTFSGGSIRFVPNVVLTANAGAAQSTVQVQDANQWEIGWEVTVFDDITPNGETRTIASIDDVHQLTLSGAVLVNGYTTANNARLRRSASLDNVVFFTPVTRGDTALQQQEAWVVSDYDYFDVADAVAITERWTSGYISGTEGGAADINTTTAGQLRVVVDPDATPTAAEYGARRLQTIKSRYFRTVVDMTVAFGTLAATNLRAGMSVSKGGTFDTANYVRVYKENNTGITNRITAEANFGGAGAVTTNVASTDNNIGLKIERIANIWRCYYSLENYPDQTWVLIREFEDTAGNMSEATSVYLTSFSGGTLDAQVMTADFDNWFYYINSDFLEQMYGAYVIGSGVFTTSSATVPADTARIEGNNYWNGTILMPTAGADAYQPRLLTGFTAAGGIFAVDLEHPFTAATGLVPYVILAAQGDLIPAIDSVRNNTLMDVVGNKADTSQYDGTSTNSSLVRLLRAVHRGEIAATGTLTTSSTTVPADTGRTEANNYWNGSWLMTVTGAVAFQPRLIVGFANAGGIFTLDGDQPFTAVPGLVAYVILNPNSQLVPGLDSTNNQTPAQVIGNKTDTAIFARNTTTRSLVNILKGLYNTHILATGTLTASSVTVPADTGRTEVDNYWNGSWLMTVTGAVAFQPRLITNFVNAGGVFTLDAQQPFTTAPGLVAYIILAPNSQLVSATDATTNTTPTHVIGSKADTAQYDATSTNSSIIRLLRAIHRGEILATGTLTTSSTTVPADTGRTEANDYWRGSWLMTVTGAVAFQPRLVVGFANAGGVFTLDAENIFSAAPGTVAYVLLSNTSPLNPSADATTNTTPSHVVGNKADTASYSRNSANSLMRYLKGIHTTKIITNGTFTTSSATVPADTGRTEADNYWNGSWLIPLTGAVALQPRLITSFANAGGVFTVDAQQPFTAATGLVTYVVVSPNSQLSPAADATSTATPAHVVGTKTDTAQYDSGTTSSLMRYMRALIDQVKEIKRMDLYPLLSEFWASDPAGIDANIWTTSFGGAGTATRIVTDTDFLKVRLNTVDAVDASTARLITRVLFRATPTGYTTSGTPKKLVVQWEAKFTGTANIDNATFFMGLSSSTTAIRTTNDIIGFGLSGGAIQTVTDSAAAETTNLPAAITLTNRNEFRLEIARVSGTNQVEFFINDVSQFTHTTNIPNINAYLFFFTDNVAAAGGSNQVDIGAITVKYFDVRNGTFEQ